MKARTLLVLALTIAAPAALAQYSEKKIGGDTPQRTTLPPGGLTLDFNEIDSNGDKMISVEEWNAFIEKLRSRSAAQGSGSGNAASPATGSTAREPSSPAKAR